jgi:ubiquitin
LKKPAGSVRFRFYKPKAEKTEPNRNRKKPVKKPSQTEPKLEKPSQTKKNRAKTKKNKPKLRKPSQTGLNWFLP